MKTLRLPLTLDFAGAFDIKNLSGFIVSYKTAVHLGEGNHCVYGTLENRKRRVKLPIWPDRNCPDGEGHVIYKGRYAGSFKVNLK